MPKRGEGLKIRKKRNLQQHIPNINRTKSKECDGWGGGPPDSFVLWTWQYGSRWNYVLVGECIFLNEFYTVVLWYIDLLAGILNYECYMLLIKTYMSKHVKKLHRPWSSAILKLQTYLVLAYNFYFFNNHWSVLYAYEIQLCDFINFW